MTEQTYEISDIDGRNKRTVTLAQYRAELDERLPYARAVAAAFRRGDLVGVERAQRAMRERFPS